MTGVTSFLQDNWLTALVVGVLLIAYMVLCTQPTDVTSAPEFIAALQEGQVTVAEFYTNT